MISLKVEELSNQIVMNKMMRMSALSKQYLEEGDFVTYFMVDSRNIFNFFRAFSVFFYAPTTLIVTQIFLYIDAGGYGAALSAIIVLSLILLIFLSYRIAKLGLRKMENYNQRMTFNLEVMAQLKQVKGMGWEDLIAMKNRELRQPENIYNKKAYTLVSLYNFVVNFSPPLVLLIIFLFNLIFSTQSSFETEIYTIVTYINLITGPLGSLPQSIIYGVHAIASSRRIDHFLAS